MTPLTPGASSLPAGLGRGKDELTLVGRIRPGLEEGLGPGARPLLRPAATCGKIEARNWPLRRRCWQMSLFAYHGECG